MFKNGNVVLHFHAKEYKKTGNEINYEKIHSVLFNEHEDQVLNKGFRYIKGYMKSYEQNKKCLSDAYRKRIVCNDGIKTKTFSI